MRGKVSHIELRIKQSPADSMGVRGAKLLPF